MSSASGASIPNLEERFLQPCGWQFSTLKSHGMTIRYGMVSPAEKSPDAVVVCLPGLSEFCEKYYETARDCLSRNLAFFVLDWPGQGKSQRYLRNPHKRHAQDFNIDVARLHEWVNDHIRLQFPDLPLIMLAHSMGGNIGLRYMHDHKDVFSCAMISAPLFGIPAVRDMPCSAILLTLFNLFMPRTYVFNGGDWNADLRQEKDRPETPRFSSDPKRALIHHLWSEHDPALRVGSPTFGWLYHAIKSCKLLCSDHYLSGIKTPTHICIAQNDRIVDNHAIRHSTQSSKAIKTLDLQGASHEILMEKDSIRIQFFNVFDAMLKKQVS